MFYAEACVDRRARSVAKKTYIRAIGYPSPSFDQGLATARARGWNVDEMPCGHDAMIDMPQLLAELLEAAA